MAAGLAFGVQHQVLRLNAVITIVLWCAREKRCFAGLPRVARPEGI
jgi:hypothetical protein